jgi:hypothetical protein
MSTGFEVQPHAASIATVADATAATREDPRPTIA